jgi:DNA-binding XRE family transcriptional regulator
MKNKQDALEKVINITEDTLLFKLSELDEDSIQIRRSIIKLLKNQKAILTLSTELL